MTSNLNLTEAELTEYLKDIMVDVELYTSCYLLEGRDSGKFGRNKCKAEAKLQAIARNYEPRGKQLNKTAGELRVLKAKYKRVCEQKDKLLEELIFLTETVLLDYAIIPVRVVNVIVPLIAECEKE